jgi:hypothetical protein
MDEPTLERAVAGLVERRMAARQAGQCRLVFDWHDQAKPSVTPPMDRQLALLAFDAAVTLLAAELAADQVRVSVLAEDVWAQRGTLAESPMGTGPGTGGEVI